LQRSGVPTRRWIVAAGAALLIAVVTFLMQIDFRVSEFFRTIHLHAVSVLAGDRLGLLVRFLVGMGVTQRPTVVMLVVLAAWSLRYPVGDLARIGLCLTGALVCIALIGGLGPGALWFVVLAVLVLTASVLRHTTAHSARIVLSSLVCAILVAANGKDLVNILGILSGRIQLDVGNRREALALRSTPEHPLLIDAWVARYVFDYRLPPGCIDWSFSAPFPSSNEGAIVLRLGDIYLLGWYSVHYLGDRGCLDLPTPKWVPLGLRRWYYEQQPCRPYLIHPEDCKPPRPYPALTGHATWRSLLTGESIHPGEQR
jgi:hypothetical protein